MLQAYSNERKITMATTDDGRRTYMITKANLDFGTGRVSQRELEQDKSLMDIKPWKSIKIRTKINHIR